MAAAAGRSRFTDVQEVSAGTGSVLASRGRGRGQERLATLHLVPAPRFLVSCGIVVHSTAVGVRLGNFDGDGCCYGPVLRGF
ncbi:hypothetical protein GUJ93_ZPchr0002g26098 [Zizania palustris]|uniref:Uncharacterized protein n=1 Tax=Zizania palustris TaxID=103762 RepID=A0A8J5SNF3_ZIZPA|nr:hypothetical protein GUJ93_ZPchr0002g26098 [Zizania palustris]